MRVLLSRTGCLVTIVWVAAIAALHAQQAPLTSPILTPVPRLMWFSGAFRPADNLPVAPVESITVAVYRERDGGDVVWRETQNVAIAADGRYSLLIGSTLADGMPLELFTSGEPRWIGITVNRPGEVEQPRVHQASVPYALKAADAETLGGLPASAYLRAPTLGRAGVAGPETSLAVTSTDPPLSADVVLPGTTNLLAKYVNGADVGNSAVYESGGAVGIGTTSPFDWMHVRFTNTNGGLTGLAVQNLGNTATSYSGMLFYDQNGALGQFQGFNNGTHEYRINNVARNGSSLFDGSINFMVGSSSKFLVASTGNIGVGVPAPGSKLDVAGDINTTTHYRIGGSIVLNVGGQNSFAGRTAGAFNTGNNNSFFGTNAGANNTGSDNSFFGRIAGISNTGSGNAFFGDGVGQSNTGSENTFIGKDAGFNNTSGLRNAFLGRGAGYANQMGFDNTAVGFQAGLNSTNACCNIFIGSFTGNITPAGSFNTLIGYIADFAAPALTNATAIGARSSVSQSNSLILGSIAGQNVAPADTLVGIGLTNPARKLHLSGVGSDGAGQTDLRITGTGQIASGLTLESAGPGGRTYSFLSTADNSGAGGFGPGAFAVFDVTAGVHRLVIESDGDVGIGTFFPDRLLSVNGGASKVGGGAWDIYSDERLKNITGPFTPGLNAVMQLQPVRYEYKSDNALGLRSSGEHIGFSAQAVQKIIPEAVSTNSKGYLLVNNDPILWTMLNAIQEQQKEIQDHRHQAEQYRNDVQQQQADIRALQQHNADLQQRLASLEAVLARRR